MRGTAETCGGATRPLEMDLSARAPALKLDEPTAGVRNPESGILHTPNRSPPDTEPQSPNPNLETLNPKPYEQQNTRNPKSLEKLPSLKLPKPETRKSHPGALNLKPRASC